MVSLYGRMYSNGATLDPSQVERPTGSAPMGIIRDLTVRPRRVAVINANCEPPFSALLPSAPLARPVTDVPPINQSDPPCLARSQRRRRLFHSRVAVIAQPFFLRESFIFSIRSSLLFLSTFIYCWYWLCSGVQ